MYCVAGEAAAKVAGIPFTKLVRNKVLKPLGLSNTGFSMSEMAKKPNFAVPFQAASYEDAVAGRFTELPLDGASDLSTAAGDMYASVLDLARWGQAVLSEGMVDGKQVLSKANIAATLTSQTVYAGYVRHPDLAPSTQYGMGWVLNQYKGNNIFEHGIWKLLVVFFPDHTTRHTLTNAPIFFYDALNRWPSFWLCHQPGLVPERRTGGSPCHQCRYHWSSNVPRLPRCGPTPGPTKVHRLAERQCYFGLQEHVGLGKGA